MRYLLHLCVGDKCSGFVEKSVSVGFPCPLCIVLVPLRPYPSSGRQVVGGVVKDHDGILCCYTLIAGLIRCSGRLVDFDRVLACSLLTRLLVVGAVSGEKGRNRRRCLISHHRGWSINSDNDGGLVNGSRLLAGRLLDLMTMLLPSLNRQPNLQRLGVLLAQPQNIVFAHRTVMMSALDPQIQATRMIDVPAMQLPDQLLLLHQVETDGADELVGDACKGLHVRRLFLSPPLGQ